LQTSGQGIPEQQKNSIIDNIGGEYHAILFNATCVWIKSYIAGLLNETDLE